VSSNRHEFINWLLKTCTQDGVKMVDIIDSEAIDVLAERLRTALQIERLLSRRLLVSAIVDASNAGRPPWTWRNLTTG
jgi:hypothetical protein